MRSRFIGLFLLVAVAAATFYGVNSIAISQPAEPTSTPTPPSGPPPPGSEPEIVGDQIDLSKPLEKPIDLTIAGYKFLIPEGATVFTVIEGPPVADPMRGEQIGDPIAHPQYTLISRGDSVVKIDNETGEIFEWDVKVEDIKHLEPLRHPTSVP